MAAPRPKQYLDLAGQAIITRTLKTLTSHPSIQGVMVAVSADDEWWPSIPELGVHVCEGGAERCHSVCNALLALLDVDADASDWVLVHDAVRPLVTHADISRLIEQVGEAYDGGLLGVPVRDTMKRTDAAGQVKETVSRELLWHALTPQQFRLGALKQALTTALEADELPTDECQAMERSGVKPLMVEGSPANIKVTHPRDLDLALKLLGVT